MKIFANERHYSDAPKVNYDHLPEVAPYTAEPFMYVGCPGKCGYLDLVFEKRGGKSILAGLNRRAPLIVHEALYFDEELPDIPCVYILSSGGPNVDGDRFTQNILLKQGAMAWIGTGAATKLAEMKFNYSGMRQTITLEEDAYLEYAPEPIIPHKHTRYISETAIVCHSAATLFYSEIYMPGRKYYGEGEIFKYDLLSICCQAKRPDNTPLFREKFIIAPARENPRGLGVMDFFDVYANVIVMTPEEKASEIYAQATPFMDRERKLAMGITRLPGQAGLLFRVLGMEPQPVKKIVTEIRSLTRLAIKGKPVMPEFPWR